MREGGESVVRPVASLIHKLEKVQVKLRVGTWQEKRVRQQLNALHYAYKCMTGSADGAEEITNSDRREIISVLLAILRITRKTKSQFAAGTAQHTLQRNRQAGLRAALAAVRQAAAGEGKVELARGGGNQARCRR